MAEAVVNVVVEQLISAAAEWIKEEISLVKGVDKELDNMKSKMQIIQTVIKDAENQSVKEKYVKIWLEKLQYVSYDMDDVLDEWNTRSLLRKREDSEENTSNEIVESSSSPTSSKFTCFPFKKLDCFSSVKQIPWRRDIALRIKDLNGQMNSVFSEMEQFKLVSKAVRNDGLSKIINHHHDIGRTTTSFVDESKVYGRDADKASLLSKILPVDTKQQKSLQVISIVGVGGLGKTTLSQLVFNDEEVKEKFGENRIWVCVSNPFDEVKVAEHILEHFKVDHTKIKSLQTLHQSIENLLAKKKFLLVLDDVWDEDFEKWERLSLCLKLGDLESIILVTTRKEEVARIMSTTSSNILKPQLISDFDCWMLMSDRAFQGRTNEDNDELEDIGKEIAKKCKGLPLAAKTLGGMFISMDTVEEWRDVLNSEIWELEKIEVELFPHIFLSYQELPSTLKRCFLILTLFPKDHKFDVEFVIHFWMAHGFLNQRTKEDDMMKTGQKYLKFLVSRAFLEDEVDAIISMHDIMHDFGLHLLGGELLSIMVHDDIEESTSKQGSCLKSTKVRHSIIGGKVNPTLIDFDVGKLRTCYIYNVPPNVTLELVNRLKVVRALYLLDCGLKQVPQSIVDLIHLRMLNLSHNSLVELPETIGNLYNLQQLFFEGQSSLPSLPQSLGNLTNLRWIMPVYLVVEKAPESVGKLINLQNMGRVQVKAGESSLLFLMDLNQLRGLLEIEFNSDYGDEVDAKKAPIGTKKHITELALLFNDHQISDGVVAALQPSPKLQTLRIYGLLPSWITSIDHLRELKVHGVKKVSTLPPLGKLQSLRKLIISEFSALEIIGREFLGIDINSNLDNRFCAFPKLVELKFFDCHKLIGWEELKPEEEENHTIQVMPILEILQFERCNMFDEPPRRLLRQASNLNKLSIKKYLSFFDFDVKEVVEGVGGIVHMHLGYLRVEMTVKNSTKVPNSINYHSYITLLDLYCGETLITYLPPMGKLPYLESLNITFFSSLKSIGREFLGIDDDNKKDDQYVAFPKLVKLEISFCHSLEEWEDLKPEDEGKLTVMPKLEHLRIICCKKLQVLPSRLLLKLFSSLKVIDLQDGEPSTSLHGEELKFGVFAALPKPLALEKLRIDGYKGTILPNWIINLNNLRNLEVKLADTLFSLPALGKLPFLEVLNIESFSVLKFIGREFLGIDDTTRNGVVAFPRLESLSLELCNELKEWEDIKPEEEDNVTIFPNLKRLIVAHCNQLEALPWRLLSKAAALESLSCHYISKSFATNIKKDKQLLVRVKEVYINHERCSLQEDQVL